MLPGWAELCSIGSTKRERSALSFQTKLSREPLLTTLACFGLWLGPLLEPGDSTFKPLCSTVKLFSSPHAFFPIFSFLYYTFRPFPRGNDSSGTNRPPC